MTVRGLIDLLSNNHICMLVFVLFLTSEIFNPTRLLKTEIFYYPVSANV